MKLFNLRIPETEHLPIQEREEITKRCLASEEMRRYKRIAPRVCGILPTVISFGFFFTTLFRWKWSFFPAAATFVASYVILLTLVLVAKVALELRILRGIIRKEIQK